MQGESINRKKRTKKMSKVQRKKLVTNQPQDLEPDNLPKNRIFIYVAILIIATFGVYSVTFQNDFTNWDDGQYVLTNPLIKPLDNHTIKEMFASENLTHRYWMGNYHPLTMLSLNLNYAFAEKDADGNPKPFGFQLINVLLHIINTLLVFFIILKLLKNKEIAFFTALLFGVHTLHVESVSWVAERKDVLYTAFFLFSLYFYVIYAQTKKITTYVISFILFVLSLLSKGQATSLAVTVILVDYFCNRKLLSLRVILEKIPYLATAFVFGLIAIQAQRQGNAIQVINTIPIFTRIGVAGFGFTMYILKLILPINLSAIYPYPDILNLTIPFYFWFGLLTVAVAGWAAFKTFKTNRIVFFSIAFFAVNIVLLLQLLPVGSAMYSDRYAYIPSIGFYLLLTYGIFKLKNNKKLKYGILISYTVLLSVLTVLRIQVWENSLGLWQDVVAKQPNSVVAWNNLGTIYNDMAKDYETKNLNDKFVEYNQKAINCFSTAIRKKPDYSSAFYNRGYALKQLGFAQKDTTFVRQALVNFNDAISIDLVFPEAYQERGSIYDWLGEYERAINDYDNSLRYSPNNVAIYVNRGVVKGKQNDLDAAIENFSQAMSLDPQVLDAYLNRAYAYILKEEYENAEKDLEQAFLLNPQSAQIYANKGLMFVNQGKYQEAVENYTKSLELEYSDKIIYNRAISYFNLKEYEKALDDFNKFLARNTNYSEVYYYRGMTNYSLGNKNQSCKDLETSANMGFEPALQRYKKLCR